MFDLQQELKNLPSDPGVYIMHNASDEVIYVGKAKVLKNRVRQYFQKNSSHTPKVRAMVAKIAYFEYIITDSEVEALVLECNLIKKYRPRYNILLKDDKHYPYIKVTLNEPYPKIFMTRTLAKDGAKYFGPYMGTNTIRNMLEIIQKIFLPPMCNRKFPEDIGKGRPCLNYHIKTCFAPCVGNVSKEEYRKVFYDICSFLEGKHKDLLKLLQKEMEQASEQLEFEKAALLRDKIRSISALEEKQKIINASHQIDEDIIAFYTADNFGYFEVFFVRGGKLLGRENYRIDHLQDADETQLMTDFVKQFYADSIYVPQQILLETPVEDQETIEEWLSGRRGRKVQISVPSRGEKRRLVELVKKNAQLAVDNELVKLKKYEEKNNALQELAKVVGFEKPPRRVESYDISNIAGSENVASMVVFENGKPAKKKYRKFKIKSFEGADDYASMQEVLYRRFRHALEEEEAIRDGKLQEAEAKFLPLPDLLLIDGGKGHLHAVNEILEQMEIEVPAFGMVKDNRHRTRALVGTEGEISISPVSSVFHLITRIQDEVHRTAISYHRQLHRKNSITSELDQIAGIGEKRKKALLNAFGSVEKIRTMTVQQLADAEGVDKRSAQNVYDYFHSQP